jgi:hypothetical protein
MSIGRNAYLWYKRDKSERLCKLADTKPTEADKDMAQKEQLDRVVDRGLAEEEADRVDYASMKREAYGEGDFEVEGEAAEDETKRRKRNINAD